MPVWRSWGVTALKGGDPAADHGRTGTAVGWLRGEGGGGWLGSCWRGDGGGGWRGDGSGWRGGCGVGLGSDGICWRGEWGGGWRGVPPRDGGGGGTGVDSLGMRGVIAPPLPPRARLNSVRVAVAPAKAAGGRGGGGSGRAGGRRKVADGRRRVSPQASSGMKAPGGTICPYAPASSPNHGGPSCKPHADHWLLQEPCRWSVGCWHRRVAGRLKVSGERCE
jgi:hypothetical protein